MPTITGNAYDVGTNPLDTSTAARIHFRIDKAARDVDNGIHFKKEVTVSTDSGGAFAANLPEYVTHPRPVDVWVGVSWLNPDGYSGGGYTATDWFPTPLHVPRAGGNLGDLLGKQVGNDLVYVGTNVPTDAEQTGFQAHELTGDIYQWRD